MRLPKRTATAAELGVGCIHQGVSCLPGGKSAGYNVYPSEIENVIATYDDVEQVAVVGAADPLWESIGVSFLVVGDRDSFDLSAVHFVPEAAAGELQDPEAH